MEDDVNLYRPRTLKQRDLHHDAQLARELDIINTGIWRSLGPLPPGWLPRATKRKPLMANPDSPGTVSAEPNAPSSPIVVP